MDDFDRQLRSFLAADAQGDGDAADRALSRLFQALPALEPARDLVAGVMARVERPPLDLPWPARLLTAAVFLLIALAWINVSPGTLFWHGDLSTGVATGAGVFGHLVRQADDLLVFGRLLRQLLAATFAALGNPLVQLGLAATVATVSVLSRCVYVLVDPRRPAR